MLCAHKWQSLLMFRNSIILHKLATKESIHEKSQWVCSSGWARKGYWVRLGDYVSKIRTWKYDTGGFSTKLFDIWLAWYLTEGLPKDGKETKGWPE
jgi:hypothetical protein